MKRTISRFSFLVFFSTAIVAVASALPKTIGFARCHGS